MNAPFAGTDSSTDSGPKPRSSTNGIDLLNWINLEEELSQNGFACVSNFLPIEQCDKLAKLYDEERLYRSTINMQRHSFGVGQYKYYAYPLPDVVQEIRAGLYGGLSVIANTWQSKLKAEYRYPPTHVEYLKTCHESGQLRPTPLILKYEAGGYNCLHQDLYGEEVFPIQIAILLSDPVEEFSGGEFIITQQRPRMQTVASVVPLKKGDMVVFAVNERPVAGKKGYYRVKMRHGVSTILSGVRNTLGVIFHDAS